jgi:hypothetical protein
MLLAGLLASSTFVFNAGAQSPAPGQSTVQASRPSGSPSGRYQPSRFSKRAELRYGMVWGVDQLTVKWAESGELIRFNWRVLDPARASAISDPKAEPHLVDPHAGVSLVIPQLEKVGKLRQASAPVAGRSYWMAFSNKGRHVKRGDRVDVVIGNFRAEGLVVD